MVRCHVKGCGRSAFKDKNHHFFRQPKNSELRKKWREFAQVPGSPTHLRICSDHFEPSCIRKKFPRPLLLPESIPTISPGQPSQENTNSVNREQTLTFERSALQDECSHKDKRIILDITKATAEESATIEIQTNNKIRIVVNDDETDTATQNQSLLPDAVSTPNNCSLTSTSIPLVDNFSSSVTKMDTDIVYHNPSTSAGLCKSPSHEIIGSVTYSGAQFGTVLSNVISGALAESRAGWPSVFYFFGIASIIWTIVFIFYGADSPSTDARIHEDEKRYIERSLGSGLDDKPDQQIAKTPWREIFTSPPVWALVVAHCGQNWGFWMLITEISIYMSSILGFKLSENGFKAALPYLTMMLLAFPISWLSDYALKKGVRRIILRKIANTLSQWGPGLALIGLCFTERGDTTLPVVILVIGVGANVGSLCGFQINHIDLSPNYAGILMSITNCFASVVAIIAPLVVSVIVTNKSDFSQWQTVFYLSAGIYFTSNTIFLIFASAERQWWDDPRAVEVTRSRQVFVNAIAVEP